MQNRMQQDQDTVLASRFARQLVQCMKSKSYRVTEQISLILSGHEPGGISSKIPMGRENNSNSELICSLLPQPRLVEDTKQYSEPAKGPESINSLPPHSEAKVIANPESNSIKDLVYNIWDLETPIELDKVFTLPTKYEFLGKIREGKLPFLSAGSLRWTGGRGITWRLVFYHHRNLVSEVQDRPSANNLIFLPTEVEETAFIDQLMLENNINLVPTKIWLGPMRAWEIIPRDKKGLEQ